MREVRRRDWLAPLKWLNPKLENPVDIVTAEKHSLECLKSARMTVLWSVHDVQQCNFADVGTRGGSLASSRGYLEIADNGQPPMQPTTQNHHTSPMCSKYTDQSLLSFCSVSTIVLREYPRISRPLHIIPVIQLSIKYLLSFFLSLMLWYHSISSAEWIGLNEKIGQEQSISKVQIFKKTWGFNL